eukprot:CAMPEP_0206386816 /NCGR_PEP_ID=MMETSP0294-20121207/16187_1 /ASSEMBLY_ACC=CAM_ASM_000327 /TAXON_ID=39354 /ORGANISM="Heterosigma akashiwo, Strain CCMP2393" /LENGTH=132 /DNA_ID=CAMNT_0053837973 /DNA_START=161 /DNA_END=556 /DNA_ORIENTATION=-
MKKEIGVVVVVGGGNGTISVVQEEEAFTLCCCCSPPRLLAILTPPQQGTLSSSQFQGFDAFFGWVIQVEEKDFPCLKILGLSCSDDALNGGGFCKTTGKVFDFWDSLRSINFGISVPLIASMVKNKFEMMLK